MKSFFLIISLFLNLMVWSQSGSDQLESSFKKNSKEELIEFLDNWNKEIQPFDYSKSTDLIRMGYEVYKKFYDPFNLYKIGLELQTERLDWVRYVIIQHRLDINHVNLDSLNHGYFENYDSLLLAKDSIIDFRPALELNDVKTLYLTTEYRKVLLDFLGDKHRPLGFGGIMNPARSRGNSEKKQEFLNRLLIIIYGHWGGYWHLETHPQVFDITFNKSKDLAVVHYRLGYEGGDAYYRLKGTQWVFVGGGLTWIE